MGVSWTDLDERTRERLLQDNPELAAEFGPGVKAAGRERAPVDPEVQALLDAAEANKQQTIDTRLEAQLVAAQARLVTSQGQLAMAHMKQRTPRSHGRGRHGKRHGFWTTFLVLFVVFVVVLAVL